MDSALATKLDGIMLLLTFILVAVAYQAAGVVGVLLAFLGGAAVLVGAASPATQSDATSD
ncbi:hypothetical protein [Haloferax sp. YSSS75]|uniref:hypothetical protein n=1 Tax=Haloferax sp. YSSS75 TaxID=3388564 RepID=UPI00398CBA0C